MRLISWASDRFQRLLKAEPLDTQKGKAGEPKGQSFTIASPQQEAWGRLAASRVVLETLDGFVFETECHVSQGGLGIDT